MDDVRYGEHDGFYLINRRIKATFEHPFLVRRDEEWGFCSAELLKVGDFLITVANGQLDEERIDDFERIEGTVRTVAIRVPGTNTYLADGVWTHNDAKETLGAGETFVAESSGVGPHFSNSGPGFSNSGGSGTGPTILSSSGSSSSESSSGSKSSGSSFSSSESSIIIHTGGSGSSAEG